MADTDDPTEPAPSRPTDAAAGAGGTGAPSTPPPSDPPPSTGATPPPSSPPPTAGAGAGSLPPSPGFHVGGADWPAQAADAVVRVVAQARERTVTPAYTLARGVVYGLLAVLLGTMAVVLLLVALVRFVNSYLPGDVWATYLLLGTILTIGGLVLWTQRRAEASSSSS